jgi:hypothetical protein
MNKCTAFCGFEQRLCSAILLFVFTSITYTIKYPICVLGFIYGCLVVRVPLLARDKHGASTAPSARHSSSAYKHICRQHPHRMQQGKRTKYHQNKITTEITFGMGLSCLLVRHLATLTAVNA